MDSKTIVLDNDTFDKLVEMGWLVDCEEEASEVE